MIRARALRFLVSVTAALAIGACATGKHSAKEDARGTPLTADEVRATFIGTAWQGSSGTFFFRGDGTYMYRSDKTTTEWGPWRYRINGDGTITGASTTYTFYRIGPGFRYHDAATDAFYRAIPGADASAAGNSGRAQLETCLGTQLFCSAE
jgi:hypothetical protein